MPTYCSITISLVSQFDLLTIPEYLPPPPTSSDDPFFPFPLLVDPDRSLVSVYIPTYPSSQFWISYSISAPRPPRALYYFKLFLDGALVVSWGCGEEDGYKGKTMFGIFDAGANEKGGRKLERRVLSFAGIRKEGRAIGAAFGDMMELRVYRSKGRRRVKPEVENFGSAAVGTDFVSKKQANGGGVSLTSAGFLYRENPQRYYQYALVDRLDQPFATFRYYYRSWEELEYLGVVSPSSSRSQSSIEIPLILAEHSPPQFTKLSTSTEVSPSSPINSKFSLPQPTKLSTSPEAPPSSPTNSEKKGLDEAEQPSTATELILLSSPTTTSPHDQEAQPKAPETETEEEDSPLRIPPAIALDLLLRLTTRPTFAPILLTNPSTRHLPSTYSEPQATRSETTTPTTEHILITSTNNDHDKTRASSRNRITKRPLTPTFKTETKTAFGVRVADLVKPQSPEKKVLASENNSPKSPTSEPSWPFPLAANVNVREKGNMGVLNGIIGSAVRRKKKGGR